MSTNIISLRIPRSIKFRMEKGQTPRYTRAHKPSYNHVYRFILNLGWMNKPNQPIATLQFNEKLIPLKIHFQQDHVFKNRLEYEANQFNFNSLTDYIIYLLTLGLEIHEKTKPRSSNGNRIKR